MYVAKTTPLFLAMASIAFVGCDQAPKIVPVSGQVLIDGEPLEHGFIRVLPNGGRAAQGNIGEAGKFTLTTKELNDGCMLGTHPVAIIALEVVGPSQQRWHAPNKYRSPKTSGITVNIKGPTDSLVVELSWDGGKPFIETVEGEE